MSDNLRDRIVALIEGLDDRQMLDDGNLASPDDIAQTIIDDLGLTVEIEPGHDPRECGCSSRAYPAESRIVGKWEQQ